MEMLFPSYSVQEKIAATQLLLQNPENEVGTQLELGQGRTGEITERRMVG
jgi:hypothetical protein